MITASRGQVFYNIQLSFCENARIKTWRIARVDTLPNCTYLISTTPISFLCTFSLGIHNIICDIQLGIQIRNLKKIFKYSGTQRRLQK